ncbi:zinc finger protein Xfin-like [Oppia nitens]|uniref:zinc finger protein Xfin-like n=1 Tax=Oppia nitens TaxID=1686743 RepID=UPI0023DCA3B9|nr:zinc finger protein Xfin-like [Oppia nitens]XP_054164631.1 zinc finger protein Xfin-like [Oppia nitens]
MARTPPVKMSYPCSECSFEAQSARQLSRHKAVTHVENALKCVLCPFVTAYQTNLLRHRREVHGICGSKGNKSCKFCGFLSEDNETLIRHQLEVHRDILKSAQVKFAKELVSAGGEDNSGVTGYASKYEQNYDLNESRQRANRSHVEEVYNPNDTQEDDEEDDDKNFWKESFMDDTPNFYMNLALQTNARDQSETNSWYVSSGQQSPASHENSIADSQISSTGNTPKSSKSRKMPIPASAQSNDDLPATRIRRQYTCNDCGFRTINPREFLYHRRDEHGQRLKIVECPYCVYACQYVQKLQRHLLLVHKLETSMTPPPELSTTSSKSNKSKPVSQQNKAQSVNQSESPEVLNTDSESPPQQQNIVPKIRVKLPTLTTPAMVTTSQVKQPVPGQGLPKMKYMSQKSNEQKRKLAFQRQLTNQKRMNDKSGMFTKKYHKCQTCGYMTNVQYLFKKHMKYHSAPKIKCEMCDFESPYSWNVDRHVKSHYSNGLFKCTKCSFACDKKQALTVHMTQHHRDKANEQQIQQALDANQTDPNIQNNEVMNDSVSGDIDRDGESLAHLFTQSLEEGPHSSSDMTNRPSNSFNQQMLKTGSLKKCKYCNFQADSFAKLQKHEITQHPEKKFQCPFCEIKFENLVWLQRHLNQMHRENNQANSIVNVLEQLNPKRKRNNKSNMPSTSTPVSQNSSNPMIDNFLGKQQGMKRKHSSLDKSSTQCQVCGYQTRWISELEKHMRVHTKERPFSCPYCSFKSKWKGDLNRHIQKYHSQLPLPDLNAMDRQSQPNESDSTMSIDFQQQMTIDYENDASILSGEQDYEDYNEDLEDIKMDEQPLPDDYEERPLVFDDLSDGDEDETENKNDMNDMSTAELVSVDMVEDDNENELQIDFEEGDGTNTADNMNGNETGEVTKSGKVKMYRCSYCDFTCSTASRFHVHFVQHLNTKPFQCSVCGHRSNWEWDVTKHIKMKSQRDTKHESAKAMLVHESGKRDYSKYNKYVVWVNQKEVMANSNNNTKIDFRAKRARLEQNEGIEFDENEFNQTNEVDFDDNDSTYNCGDPESIVITPDICFEVQGEEDAANTNVEYNQGFNPAFQPNVPYNSNTNTSVSDDSKLLQCSYCDFKHKESKVMVSHLSNHAGMKPYRCRRCGFDSNWREVVVRHCVSKHQSTSEDVEQRFRCTVNKTMCKIIDDNIAPKVVSTSSAHLPSAVQAFQESHQSVRISGFKGSFVCDLCPFRAEKAFHMDFHVKRHQPSSGPFKCPHCPYWVNAKKSLVKHMLLHSEDNMNSVDRNSVNNTNDGMEFMSTDNSQVGDESEHELTINEGRDMVNQYYQQNMNFPVSRQSASVSKNRCDKCPFIAGTKTQLLYHKQFHRPNRNATYSCSLCTYSVSYLHLLNQHMKVHYQNPANMQSPINYYELPQEDEQEMEDSDDRDESDIPFTWVQIGNNKRKLFQCRFCSTTSKRRTYIYVHEKLHSNNTNEAFRCSQCVFETRDSNDFLSHLSDHKIDSNNENIKKSNETNFTTPSVSVIDVDNIRQGSRRMFSYVCRDCPAAFKSPGDLKIHSAFHGNEHPHHCPYCNYKAKNKPQLCKHLYVHTAEYITKRANCYPDGTKLLIGDAVDQMKRDLKCPNDNSQAFQSPNGTNSLLKKTDSQSSLKADDSTTPIIPKDIDSDRFPKRAALFQSNGQNPTQQMILLEMNESKAYFEKLRTGNKQRFSYRCSHCPAIFNNVNTLTFHVSLHGSDAPNKCKHCSYSTISAQSLLVHKQLHNSHSFNSVSNPQSLYNHRCDRCPATFSKKTRLEKHLTLHGLDAKWKCDQCDYAVHYAATLVKHRACHQLSPDFKTLDSEDNQLEVTELEQLAKNKETNNTETTSATVNDNMDNKDKQNDEQKDGEKLDDKIMYCCDRCPYVNSRKDAVQSHLKRHDQQIRNVRDGKQCPYCDYTCLQSSYLRDHIQWHFEPIHDRKPILFTYFNDMEIWKLETLETEHLELNEDINEINGKSNENEDEAKQLFFKDLGINYEIQQRFEPLEDDHDLYELYEGVESVCSDSEDEEDIPPVNESISAL